jgi:hypothetical protein
MKCLLSGTNWILNTLVLVRSRLIPCKIFRVQSGTGIGFSPALRFSRVGNISLMLYTRLHLHVALTEWTNGRNLGTLKKNNPFLETGGTLDRKALWLGHLLAFPCAQANALMIPELLLHASYPSSGFNFIKIKPNALKLKIIKLANHAL